MDITEHLLTALKSLNLSDEEYNYRKEKLLAAEQKKGESLWTISNEYFNLAHEIKAFLFLQQFGLVEVSSDRLHTPGCDCTLNQKYQLECVCSSGGDAIKNGLAEFATLKNLNQIVDYGEKEKILLSRLTSSLKEKRDFFLDHQRKGTIDSSNPYIVFLGLGELSMEMFVGKYGIELTGILFGKGAPYIRINSETGEFLSSGYTFEPVLHKKNGSEIGRTIFQQKEYKCISGIIFSKAGLNDLYSTENTWLFVNPMAHTKIVKKDFSGMIYWDERQREYRPYKKGRRID